MIKVRCRECGYLQTLSEERLVTLSEDSLACPHCHAVVPIEWNPVDSESIPEEARHKMLAFSRRILNGAELTREMVYALESLVRHYGATEEAAKALGIGYARLGETRKAEDFLRQAMAGSPSDAEILRAFLEVRLAEEDFDEAERVGRSLLAQLGSRAEDGDVARTALALIGAGKGAEASRLMESYSSLDSRNSLVKEARRALGRTEKTGLRSILSRLSSLTDVFQRHGSEGHNGIGPAKRKSTANTGTIPLKKAVVSVDEFQATDKERVGPERGIPGCTPRVMLEYWVFSASQSVPEWEKILRHASEEQPGGRRTFEIAAQWIADKSLTISHMTRRESKELFEYPEELIPRNSRNLSPDDLGKLKGASFIARIRLVTDKPAGLDYLATMVRLVAAVRDLTDGVVQDAVSHTLWGEEEWKRQVVAAPLENMAASHVQFEALEEAGSVWIHSHGMQKFGLPEIEMEGIPVEWASSALNLMKMIADTLVATTETSGLDLGAGISISNTPIRFKMNYAASDSEGHFPIGSLKVFPYLQDYDPHGPDTLKHVLKMSSCKYRKQQQRPADKTASQDEPVRREDRAPDSLDQRQRFLEARDRARSELAEFKKSFQESKKSEGKVHAVKVGFPLQEGQFEWMWVSLDAWRGKSLVGFVQNTPVGRKDLHKGSRVQISEGEVFDWVIAGGEGVLRGAYTEIIPSSV